MSLSKTCFQIQDLPTMINRQLATSNRKTFINTEPYFQRDYSAWNDEMKTKFIISIICKFNTNPLWLIKNEKEKSLDLLDGKHRLMTAVSFFDEQNGFALQSKYIDDELLKKKFGGKKFKDWIGDEFESDRMDFHTFEFSINCLPSSELAPDRVVYWWNILNKSSKPLNHYELMKILFDNLYTLIAQHSEKFKKTILYDKKEKDGTKSNKRGELNYSLLQLIAITENILPKSYSSFADLYNKWLEQQFGNRKEDIDKKIIEKTNELNERCKLLLRIIDIFTTNGLFTKDNMQANRAIAARCTALIKADRISHYTDALTAKFKTDIFDGIKEDCLGVQQRNGKFQRVLIESVDKAIEDILGGRLEPRRFTLKQKMDKLAQQEGKCVTCKLQIQGTGHGDHIKQFAAGGKTIPENLQILCRRCHELKESTLLENVIVKSDL